MEVTVQESWGKWAESQNYLNSLNNRNLSPGEWNEKKQLSRAPPTGTKKQRLKFKADTEYCTSFFWKSSHNEKEYKTYFKLFLFMRDGSSWLRDPNCLTTGHWKYIPRDKSSHGDSKIGSGERLNIMLNDKQLKEMGGWLSRETGLRGRELE